MTKTAKQSTEPFKIISLRKLSQASKVNYKMIYNNLTGHYNSLEPNTKTILANAAYEELTKFFDYLGYEIKIKRKSYTP